MSSDISFLEVGRGDKYWESFAASLNQLEEFQRHGVVKCWVVLRAGKKVASISASLDDSLKEKTGFFGCFECEDDVSLAQELLNLAADYLKSLGCDKMVGPVDLSIYRAYRVQTKGFDREAHPGEPRNPSYYEKLLLAAGLEAGTFWRSWDFDSKTCDAFYQAMAKEVLPLEEGLKAYDFQKYDLQNYEKQCKDLMPLIVDGFWPNFGGSRPTTEEFVRLFAATKHVICTDCSRLVYDSAKKLVGMSYACQVPGDPEAIVYHSFAIDPAHRKSGIGQKIFAVALEQTVKKYKKIVGALAKEGRTAYDKMGAPTREYKVFSKRIAP